jgi:hypothetical protein
MVRREPPTTINVGSSEAWQGSGSADVTVSEATSTTKTWQGIGGGVDGAVWSAVAGTSGKMYFGGEFSGYVAKWEGNTLTKLTGLSSYTDSLAIDSSGNIYAAGSMKVMKYSGSSWTQLGSSFDGGVYAVAIDSSGNPWAVGSFTGYVKKYTGGSWQTVTNTFDYYVTRIVAGANGTMYVSGRFGSGDIAGVAYWNGSSWSIIGQSLFDQTNDNIYALAFKNNTLYVGGAFSTTTGGKQYNNIAMYSGGA